MRAALRALTGFVVLAPHSACGGRDPRSACAEEFGEAAASELVYTDDTHHSGERLLLDGASFQMASIQTEEDFSAFWTENERLLSGEMPDVDFATRQAVVTDLPEEMCWALFKEIAGFYRSADGDGGIVAELALLPECNGTCEGYAIRVYHVYAVERGDLEVCSWSEVCEPDSGY